MHHLDAQNAVARRALLRAVLPARGATTLPPPCLQAMVADTNPLKVLVFERWVCG